MGVKKALGQIFWLLAEEVPVPALRREVIFRNQVLVTDD